MNVQTKAVGIWILMILMIPPEARSGNPSPRS